MRGRWRFHGWNMVWPRERSESFIKTIRYGTQSAATHRSPTSCGAWGSRSECEEVLTVHSARLERSARSGCILPLSSCLEKHVHHTKEPCNPPALKPCSVDSVKD